MSRVVRRSAAQLLVASLGIVILIPAPGLSQADGAVTLPIDPADPARCAAWEADEPSAGTRTRTAHGGFAVSAAAVEVEAGDLTCTMTRESVDELLARGIGDRSLFEGLGVANVAVLDDGVDDAHPLSGPSLTGELDPALDIARTYLAKLDLNRREATRVVRLFGSDAFQDDVTTTFPRPPREWIEAGEYHLVILDLVGDQLGPSDTPRYWQLGLQAGAAERAVPGTITEGNPLSGIQHLLTFARTPEGDGIRTFAGHSNFASDRLGAGGTQYYNAAGNLAVLEGSGWVGFLYPAAYEPLGSRPMSYDPQTGAWDLVQAPGGPMSFVPSSADPLGMFDLMGLVVEHTPVSMPAIIGDQEAGSPLDWPSHILVVFATSLFDPAQPVIVDLGYAVSGTQVRFTDLEADPLGGGLYSVPFGIPQYGGYALTDLSVHLPGESPAERAAMYEDAIRALGASSWAVTEDAGPLHGPIPRAWMSDPDALPSTVYDIEQARQLLTEAGWVLTE